MKRITLCAFGARYTHSNMALHCLKKAVPFDIRILEFSTNDRLSRAIEKIVENSPDAVGFSCYIWSIEHVLKAASCVKKILPDCFILLGGPEAGSNADVLMKKHSFIDMIIRGEGEIPFAHFTENFSNDKPILDTPSACIRSGKDIITTPDAPPADLNDLPFIYDDLSAFENKTIYYETSRGCPYKCAYCMSADENTRFLDISRVEKELEFFLKSNVRRVKLTDRTFNFPAERTYDIFRILINLSKKYPDSNTNFHFEISACLLTDEILELLQTAKPGLIQLEIGVQSTNEETLRIINRSHDLDKLLANTKKLCSMNNIHVHTDLISGLPKEDYSSFAKSFDDVYSLGAEQLQLGFLKVLNGSPMQGMAQEYGIEYTDYPPYEVLKTNCLSFKELRRLHDIADIVEAVHNTGNFATTLRLLIKDSAFDFFESFTHYAKEKGWFSRPQPKQRLFELLFGFSGYDKLIKEALIYDWLMLEKPRKWPVGLVPNLADKNETRKFFSNSENLQHYSHLSASERSKRCFICEFNCLFGEETTLLFDYHQQNKVSVNKIILCQ